MNKLLENIDRLHTTELYASRVRANLSLDTDDVVSWCRERILAPDAVYQRKYKNWYVTSGNVIITIIATSMTIVTAHFIEQ